MQIFCVHGCVSENAFARQPIDSHRGPGFQLNGICSTPSSTETNMVLGAGCVGQKSSTKISARIANRITESVGGAGSHSLNFRKSLRFCLEAFDAVWASELLWAVRVECMFFRWLYVLNCMTMNGSFVKRRLKFLLYTIVSATYF